MLITVAELPEYIRSAGKLLTAEERMEVVEHLAARPRSGDLIQGTGGIRKLRWSRGAVGKATMNTAFKSIRKGLKQAIAQQKGSRVPGLRLHVPAEVDVKAVRERTGLTQEQFAAKFAISLGTLRHWERGDRKPHGTALVLLNVIAKEPKAVMRAIEATSR